MADDEVNCWNLVTVNENKRMTNQQAKKAKQAEIERKRAEVRKRMEEASKAKKAKKGFMTPERKKKLRVS